MACSLVALFIMSKVIPCLVLLANSGAKNTKIKWKTEGVRQIFLDFLWEVNVLANRICKLPDS